MTALPTPANALQKSERIIHFLEQRRDEFPYAEEFLAIHRPSHEELERNTLMTRRAIAAWRASLAHRWDCEVTGCRLYKQIYQQFVVFYGSAAAPEVQLISRGDGEPTSPAELLADLRRMEAALIVNSKQLPFAGQRLAELTQVCAALASAINETNDCEAERREAVLTQRMAQEAHRRLYGATCQALAEHYGEQWLFELEEAHEETIYS